VDWSAKSIRNRRPGKGFTVSSPTVIGADKKAINRLIDMPNSSENMPFLLIGLSYATRTAGSNPPFHCQNLGQPFSISQPSTIMLAKRPMRTVAIPSDIIVFGPTNPTPFSSTTTMTRWTLDMIASTNLFTVSSTRIARLGIGFKPATRSNLLLLLPLVPCPSCLLAGFVSRRSKAEARARPA